MTMTKARIYEILNKADEGDRVSMMVDRFLAILIIANLLAICLESVDSIYTVIGQYLHMFEVVSLAIFTIEYLVRLWCADANQSSLRKTSFGKRCEYIFSFTGLVDLIAILPSLIQLFLGGFDSRWVRLLRLVRILKISHYSSAFDDLGEAIYAERESFLAVLYLFAVSIFASSALMYAAENHVQPEKFVSIPQTMWWSIVTLTTVGYGDVSPITPLGQFLGALTAVVGVCVVAMLAGLVATSFSKQMDQKRARMEAEIADALADGVISREELRKISRLRHELNLSKQHVDALIRIAADAKQKDV